MKNRTGAFSLNDGVLDEGEKELVGHFLQQLVRRYKIDLSENEFQFLPVGAGLSKSSKIITQCEDVYPYFLKISDIPSINSEVSNYNRASSKIPPLYIPPIEMVISGDNKKYKSENTKNIALVAFKYITGSKKGDSPRTLFDSFGLIDQYRMIELIDELFQTVLGDMHAFTKHVGGPKFFERETQPEFFVTRDYVSPSNNPFGIMSFQHYNHNVGLFQELGDDTINSMVERYNHFQSSALSFEMPHGMVHGDLHCENVIVNKKLSPILIDFEMLRKDGCILNDYAEFEVAMLVAALDHDVVEFGPCARTCYDNEDLFSFFGIDKFSRCVRSIRSNLGHRLFNLCGMEVSRQKINSLTYLYYILLLRYLCSYSWVSVKSFDEKRSLVVVGVLNQIFNQVLDSANQLHDLLVVDE